MDFDSEQQLLKTNVRNFMEREIIPVAGKYDRLRPFPKELALELLDKVARLDYLGALVPAGSGGQGLDFSSWGLIVEELGRAWAGFGIMVSVQAGGAFIMATKGTDEQKKKFLAPLMAGNKIVCVCLTEPDFGSDLEGIQTTATLDGDHYVINGNKVWATNGSLADIALVLAATQREPKQLSILIADKETFPFTASPMYKLGCHANCSGEISFEDYRVPLGNVLGQLGKGYKIMLALMDLARLSMASIAVGLAQAAVETAIRYAQQRHQFGRPIGSFQLIQEMIVDMVAETEAARLLAKRGWFTMDRGERCDRDAGIAKVFAVEAAMRVTSKAIRIHGVYGLAEEFSLERYFRDAVTLVPPDGTLEIMKLTAGRSILGISAIT